MTGAHKNRTGFPLAQTPGRSLSGTRGGGTQPRNDPPAAPQQNGAPLPTDRHDPSRPAGLRVEVRRRGGTTAAGPLGPPAFVLAHGYPGPCHEGRQGGFPTTPVTRRPVSQPAGGSGLGSMDNGYRPATHAVARGVPPAPTNGFPLGPPPRPHTRSVVGPAEPPQGLDDDPRRTIPTRAST